MENKDYNARKSCRANGIAKKFFAISTKSAAITLVVSAVLLMDLGLVHLRYENARLRKQSEKYYQMACNLNDIARFAIYEENDSVVRVLYEDLRQHTDSFNVSFRGEELDTLCWWY